jgi:clan AA aspartic protease (TIGR02281 family)
VLEKTAMIRFRVALMILGTAVAMSCAAGAARAGQSQTEDVLKSNGLSVRRGGSTYVLAAESEVQLKLTEAQRIFKQLSFALRQRRDFEQSAVERRRFLPALLEERILLNRQLQAVNRQDVVLHNQLVGRINEVSDQLSLLQARTGDPRRKQDIDNEVAQRRAQYIQVIFDLRELVDATSRRYGELSKDDKIKTALDALNSKSKSPVKLGPSRGFDESLKQLVNREKFVLSKAVEMRRKGGVFEVDVTVNGKETTPMIFDTGASFVALSAEFAAKVGLNPQPTDPTIEMRDATGGVTAAKLMTISTVRVGPFTANNVDCVIMPPGKRDVPLLLGQTFINQFTHKVDNGRLLLSKVDTIEPPGNSPGTSKKTTKAKRSGKSSIGSQAPAAAPASDRPF